MNTFTHINKLVSIIDQLRAERDEAAFALRAVLAGKPVRNADEIIARSEGEGK